MGIWVMVSGRVLSLAAMVLVNFTKKLQKSKKNVPMAFAVVTRRFCLQEKQHGKMQRGI